MHKCYSTISLCRQNKYLYLHDEKGNVFQGKAFNIMVIQVYTPTSNTEEADIEWFYDDLQDLLELKDVLFILGDWMSQKDVLFILGDWNSRN